MRTKHPSPNPMLTRRQALGALVASAPAALAGCTAQSPAAPTSAAPQTHTIRILATSDLHGKMLPYNYPADEADASGGLAQVATAVSQLRDENTLLIDVGDTIQDNMAEIFANDEAHPMVVGLNTVGYDIGVLGNHEFDFGMVCEQGEDGWKMASKSARPRSPLLTTPPTRRLSSCWNPTTSAPRRTREKWWAGLRADPSLRRPRSRASPRR